MKTHQQSYIISNLCFVAVRNANVPYQLERKGIWMRRCKAVDDKAKPEGQKER